MKRLFTIDQLKQKDKYFATYFIDSNGYENVLVKVKENKEYKDEFYISKRFGKFIVLEFKYSEINKNIKQYVNDKTYILNKKEFDILIRNLKNKRYLNTFLEKFRHFVYGKNENIEDEL